MTKLEELKYANYIGGWDSSGDTEVPREYVEVWADDYRLLIRIAEEALRVRSAQKEWNDHLVYAPDLDKLLEKLQ